MEMCRPFGSSRVAENRLEAPFLVYLVPTGTAFAA